MSIYDQLDLNPVINADATLTKLGGSLMPPEVLTAMNQAAEQFVDMFELQLAVGERLAKLTNNEAAYVCSGAAAGLYLSALACGLKDDPLGIQTLHGSDRNEVIVQRAHRNAYWPSVELAGARLVEIGDASLTTEDDLRAVVRYITYKQIALPVHLRREDVGLHSGVVSTGPEPHGIKRR